MVLDAQEVEILMPTERILVVQTAFLGDSILTLPMIQQLSREYPEASIDVVCHPSSSGIFKASEYINEVIVYDKRGIDKGVINLLRFARRLKARKYTKVFSPHRSARTSILVKMTGTEDTTGFSNASLGFMYKTIVPYRTDLHEVQRNLLLAGFKNAENEWQILPEIKISDSDIAKIEKNLSISETRNIAIAPSSVWATKRYPAGNYAEIIRYLLDRSFNIFLIGGKEDEAYCSRIASEFGGKVVNCAGKYSITESVAILKKCMLLVSNDSAPAHMALCADIPVLMIYCSTVAGFGFYPYSSSGKYISYDKLSCKPCGIHGHKECPEGHFKCGKELKAEEVIKVIEVMTGS